MYIWVWRGKMSQVPLKNHRNSNAGIKNAPNLIFGAPLNGWLNQSTTHWGLWGRGKVGVDQNSIYTVYTRYEWQGNRWLYSAIHSVNIRFWPMLGMMQVYVIHDVTLCKLFTLHYVLWPVPAICRKISLMETWLVWAQKYMANLGRSFIAL
jgi:hypothetical protein